MTEPGRYVELEGRPAVRFQRSYSHPIDRVWAAVTQPAQLVKWFPSALEFEPRIGGAVRFSGDPHLPETHGVVLTFEPPRRFAFSWGTNEVHLELVAITEDSTKLTLSDILTNRDEAARNASGWTTCLRELDNVIAGISCDGPHSETNRATFRPTYDSYCAAGLPHGAPIPD
jgi:uncharacterized protein YndB with AHSA1/START domain